MNKVLESPGILTHVTIYYDTIDGNGRVLGYKTCLDTKPILYQGRFCSLTDG